MHNISEKLVDTVLPQESPTQTKATSEQRACVINDEHKLVFTAESKSESIYKLTISRSLSCVLYPKTPSGL